MPKGRKSTRSGSKRSSARRRSPSPAASDSEQEEEHKTPLSPLSSTDESNPFPGFRYAGIGRKKTVAKRNCLLRLLSLIGWLCVVGGIGYYVWAHWEEVSSVGDAPAYALLVIGALLLFLSPLLLRTLIEKSVASGTTREDVQNKFDFTVLSKAYQQDAESLDTLLETEETAHYSSALPKKQAKQLRASVAALNKQREALRKQEAKERSDTLQKQLKELDARVKKVGGKKSKLSATEKLAELKEVQQSLKSAMQPLRKKRCFVVDFVGDMLASQVSFLKQFVDFVLAVRCEGDTVLIRLTSPGGGVCQYGYAAGQIARLRGTGVEVVVCVDIVAASGGYMMACVADRIIAAPFAAVGSVGVVAGIPNVSKVLKKNDVDYHLFTAGKHKRTVTVMGEVRPEGIKKFQSDIDNIHRNFLDHVTQFRGDSVKRRTLKDASWWLAADALELGLVDRLATSDTVLRELTETHTVVLVEKKQASSGLTKLFAGCAASLGAVARKGFRALVWGGAKEVTETMPQDVFRAQMNAGMTSALLGK